MPQGNKSWGNLFRKKKKKKKEKKKREKEKRKRKIKKIVRSDV